MRSPQELFGISSAPKKVESLSIHPMLAHPQEWLREHREQWQACFPALSRNHVIIGCGDPRVKRDIAYPGLGGLDVNLQTAADRIIAFRRTLPNRQIVLQTHDSCAAMIKAVTDHGLDPKHADAFAQLWGKNVTELIVSQTGDQDIAHKHLAFSGMGKSQYMEVMYLDCTDRFKACEDLPYGPTISLMNPGGFRLHFRACFDGILGNCLERHLASQLEFMAQHVLKSHTPLAIVVIRFSREFNLSNSVQRLAEEYAKNHPRSVKVLPVDEYGKLHELEQARELPAGCD